MKPNRLVRGVGINDADYVVRKNETIGYVGGKRKLKTVWVCPYYETWANMLSRCYSAKTQDRQPTYVGCSVSEEWLTFSAFKNWMKKQEWEGKHLDKDILIKGNKVYSSDACIFVTQTVNSFTTDSGAARGDWMIGVSWNKRDCKFQSNCKNPFTNKKEHLGHFTTEMEAHQAWLKRKLELARLLASEQADSRVSRALVERYTSYTN